MLRAEGEHKRQDPSSSSAMKSTRHRNLLVVLGITVVLALAGVSGALMSIDWRLGGQASSGMRVSSLHATLSPREQSPPLIRVEMKVKNNTDQVQVVDAWWFLARPGDRQPWLRYQYQSQIRNDLFLEPKSAMKLVWEEELATPGGEYQLSGWVHAGPSGEQKPADGVLSERLLRIPPAALPYLRRNAPSVLEIEGVEGDPFFQGVPTLAPVGVWLNLPIRNKTARDVLATVRWDLIYQGEGQPFEASPALYGGILVNQKLTAGRTTVVSFRREISPRAGTYFLLVRVRESSSVGDQWDDTKLFTTKLQITENSASNGIARIAEPTGPVSIERLAVEQTLIRKGTPLSVSAKLVSSSSAEEEVGVWWFLSSPGVNEPWLRNDFLSHTERVKVRPGAVTEVKITDQVPVAPGSYELSVWVHVVGKGRDDASDGAWFARGIVIQ